MRYFLGCGQVVGIVLNVCSVWFVCGWIVLGCGQGVLGVSRLCRGCGWGVFGVWTGVVGL